MTSRMTLAPELSPTLQMLQLQKFRWGLLSAEFSAAIVGYLLGYPVADWPLLSALLALHCCSNLVWPSLPQLAPYSLRLFGVTILFDVTILSILLALAGGASNGLIALLLLPVAMSAVLLPAQAAYLTALIAIAVYTLLLQTGAGQSVEPMHVHLQTEPFNQHMWQMGWAFGLSALLIAWFISAQAQLVRHKSMQLMVLQQQQGRQEQMLAVATYAANAAHDLATPLQTLGMLSEELADGGREPELLADLQQQIQKCQQIVQQLRQSAQKLRGAEASPQALVEVVQHALQLWLVSRPDISIELSTDCDDSICTSKDALAWTSALFNILDNAADASYAAQNPRLQLQLQLQQQQLSLQIRDFGTGLSAEELRNLGKVPQHSEQGLGLGQFLANVSLERLGARLTRENAATGGLITRIIYKAN